ncbi:MAG: polysulfide reductase NrfD [Chloroflexi bacterium]|nr:polysulfide reductase NrfD [Chloroflexota bacterium]
MESTVRAPKVRIGSREIELIPFWLGLLVLGLIFGGIGAYQVLRYGLDVTGLTNQVPWGLWITIDLTSIALGGSAFVFGVIVYLLRIKRFETVGRVAVLLGFLGYSTAGLVLFFDIGRPLHFWHPMIFWQPHSLLWEITMCVALYLTVLMAEVVPVILEHPIFSEHSIIDRFPILRLLADSLEKLAHTLHKMGPFLAVLGLTLSLLHQASLGATYGVLAGRGMAFSPTAPILFVFSAMGGGTALLFLVSVIIFRVLRPGMVKDDVFYDIARIAGGIVLLCTYIRVWDWAVVNYYSFNQDIAMQRDLLNQIAPYTVKFWAGQVFLAIISGAILLSAKRIRNFKVLMLAAVGPILCVFMLRWTYNFAGLIASISYDPFTPTVQLNSYIPTWQEWAVGIGVISYWLFGFSLAARFLPFKAKKSGHEGQ